MRLTVVSDSHGKILSLFSVPHPAGPAGATLAYVPKPGERVHVLDVPKGFEKETTGGAAQRAPCDNAWCGGGAGPPAVVPRRGCIGYEAPPEDRWGLDRYAWFRRRCRRQPDGPPTSHVLRPRR